MKPNRTWKFFRIRFFPFIVRLLGALACVAITKASLSPFELYLTIQIITLIFLLPVIVSTIFWGLTPGILASFTAFLVFNYYYIQPYHSFQVHGTQDLITLIIFLIVAVIMSQLIGRAREGIRQARIHEWEATRMYELISALSSPQDPHQIARVLAARTQETFNFDLVTVKIADDTGPSMIFASDSKQENQVQSRSVVHSLVTARGVEGEIEIVDHQDQLPPEKARLLEAYISQGALALERIRLTKSENKARVLEESDHLKSSLLNSVSHELRSPLAAIKASVSSLRSGTVEWDTPAREDLLATIEEETDHLNLLVGNLLDMSRIESGALTPKKRWNSIEEIAMGVIAKMRKQLHDHHLEVDFPADLPLVPTDYVLIEQVFTNLISNSIKYAPGATTITVTSSAEGNMLHTRVVNQGPGVPEEHLERIFDKFYRVTAADRITGTGLGLSICKGIIEAHSGKIWAANKPGGFEFHFTLPLSLNGALPEIPRENING